MAQKTRAEILTEINTLLADNTTGAISAEDVRNVFIDIKDSFYNGFVIHYSNRNKCTNNNNHN
jgi:hypothetical protein